MNVNETVGLYNDEHRLLKALLDIYEEEKLYGRPIHNLSDGFIVNMGVSLNQIMDLDEINQALTLQVWMSFVSDTMCEFQTLCSGGNHISK